METIPLDDPKKISGHRSLNAMVLWDKVDSWSKKRNLPSLLSFSALLVCISPHCRLRDWCGNLRKASGHVVCRLDQSASFRILDSTFYFPHSATPHFTHSRNWVPATLAISGMGGREPDSDNGGA